MKSVSSHSVKSRKPVVSPDTLTDGVPKVQKASQRSFRHFWHLHTQEHRGVSAHPPQCTSRHRGSKMRRAGLIPEGLPRRFRRVRTGTRQYSVCELRRILLLRASVNKVRGRVGAVTSRPLPHPVLMRVVTRAPEYPIEVAICKPSSQAATAHS